MPSNLQDNTMKFTALLQQRTEMASMPSVVTLQFSPSGQGLPQQLNMTVAKSVGDSMQVGGHYEFTAALVLDSGAMAEPNSDSQG